MSPASATQVGATSACVDEPKSPAELRKAASCLYNMATEDGNWELARQALDDLTLEHPRDGWLKFSLGRVLMDGGLTEPSESEAVFRDALARFGQNRDHTGSVYALFNIYQLLAETGDLEGAERTLEDAEDAASAADDPALQQAVLVRKIAWQIHAGGDLWAVYLELRRLEREPDIQGSDRRKLLWSLADVAYRMRRYDLAREHLSDSLDWVRQESDRYNEAAALLNQLTLDLAQRRDQRQRPELLVRAHEIVAVARTASNTSVLRDALVLAGELEGGAQGVALIEESLRLGTDHPDRSQDALGFGALATAIVENDPQRALDLLKRAFPEGGSTEHVIWGWHDIMTVSWSTLSTEDALSESERILSLIDAEARTQQSPLSRAYMFGGRAEAFYWLASKLFETHLATGEQWLLQKGFEVLERARARTLREHDDSESQEPLPDLFEVQSALHPNEAIVSLIFNHGLGPRGRWHGGSWALVLTAESANLFELPAKGELNAANLARFAKTTNRTGGVAAARLYDELLREPIESLPPEVSSLILVPDDELFRLPFAVLRPEPHAARIGTEYRVSVSPAILLWHGWRQQETAVADGGALVFANPKVEGERLADRSLDKSFGKLGELRHAVAEGKVVVSRLGGELLRGADASIGQLEGRDLAPFPVLHFAAHSIIDHHDPSRSAILLADEGDSEGTLTPQEIGELNLDGKLIVLSSCEGAEGEIVPGEGVISLANAFFRAGAHAVVANLWKVRDDDSRRFFEIFYEEVSTGAPIDRALQTTQIAMERDGYPVEAWAGFTLIGSADLSFSTSPPRPPSQATVAFVIVLLLIGGTLTLVYRQLRHRASR